MADDLMESILRNLSHQHISGEDLLNKLQHQYHDLTEREMRQAIEDLRFTPEGANICSSFGGGYWIGTHSEVEKYLERAERPALTVLARLKRQRDALRRRYRQIELPLSITQRGNNA